MNQNQFAPFALLINIQYQIQIQIMQQYLIKKYQAKNKKGFLIIKKAVNKKFLPKMVFSVKKSKNV